MSENRDTREPSRDLGGPQREMGSGRERQAKLLGGRLCCLVGILFGVGAIVYAVLGDAASVTPGALGAALGILGYFLGSRRLGTATIVLCVFALFFGLAASQGLIPGIDASDRTLPANEPATE